MADENAVGGLEPASILFPVPEWTMAQDRFFAYVDKALIDAVVQAGKMGAFSQEKDPGLLHPGATSSSPISIITKTSWPISSSRFCPISSSEASPIRERCTCSGGWPASKPGASVLRSTP
jgi:hypothetical protein